MLRLRAVLIPVLAAVGLVIAGPVGDAAASHIYVSVSCSTSAVRVWYSDGSMGWVNPCSSSSATKNVHHWFIETGRQHYVENTVTRVRYWTTCAQDGTWVATDVPRYIWQKRVVC